jgi:hypothetical protein
LQLNEAAIFFNFDNWHWEFSAAIRGFDLELAGACWVAMYGVGQMAIAQ